MTAAANLDLLLPLDLGLPEPPAPAVKSWRNRACRDQDPDVFWPDLEDEHGHVIGYDLVKLHTARRICAACPVADWCATAGEREPRGVWGGLTGVERHRKWDRERKRRVKLERREREGD